MTRLVKGKLPWLGKEAWYLPDNDTRIEKCFTYGTGDLELVVPMIYPHLRGWSTCIQAGGLIGFWPLRLETIFERVITFEPTPENFECLLHNIQGNDNITAYNAALWSDDKMMFGMKLDATENNNSGAHYIGYGDEVRSMTIDSLHLDDVDLIYLDIEGAEYDALLGAVETIKRCKPIIGIEDKGHGARYSSHSPIELLENMGYQIIGRPFKLDVILAYKGEW